MATQDKSPWFGQVKGLTKQTNEHFRRDKLQRQNAVNILSEKEVQGHWDANRVLMTTLGGVRRQITPSDLAAFRRNMQIAQRSFGGKSGITARQVIDAASDNPRLYSSSEAPYRSDIDKARAEITMCLPVSAKNDTIRFITSAGKDSKVSRHVVIVKFMEFRSAGAQLAALDRTKPAETKKEIRKIARWLLKQNLSFDCDCERHRYFFRYVASIGGFAAGRLETGYPKIRNPNLKGVACKHVLRVMADIETSPTVLNFVERHLASLKEYRATTELSQKEAEKEGRKVQRRAQDPQKLDIISTKTRQAMRRAQQLKRQLQNKAQGQQKPTRKASMSRTITEGLKAKAGRLLSIAKDKLFKLFGR